MIPISIRLVWVGPVSIKPPYFLKKEFESLFFKCALISSLGTDGIDGNTKFAGAITENFFLTNNEIDAHLKNNDSNSFFKKYGGLIETGHTHTNLMDIGIILNWIFKYDLQILQKIVTIYRDIFHKIIVYYDNFMKTIMF